MQLLTTRRVGSTSEVLKDFGMLNLKLPLAMSGLFIEG
jgi:hypothetical protein